MKISKLAMKSTEKDALLFHLAFAVLSALALLLPLSLAVGVRFLILVLAYNIALPLAGNARGNGEWTRIWRFALALSVFQVFPDWFLSAQLGVLVFPEDGLFKIGTVSSYMAGLWTIPVFMIVVTGLRVKKRRGNRAALIAVIAVSLAVFGLSELLMGRLGSWHAANVKVMLGPAALYILTPEIILGLAAYYVYRAVRKKPLWVTALSAFLVMLLYLGSACWFYFIIEKLMAGRGPA